MNDTNEQDWVDVWGETLREAVGADSQVSVSEMISEVRDTHFALKQIAEALGCRSPDGSGSLAAHLDCVRARLVPIWERVLMEKATHMDPSTMVMVAGYLRGWASQKDLPEMDKTMLTKAWQALVVAATPHFPKEWADELRAMV